MGISWVSYYACAVGPERLRQDNERRAAAVYRRWRRALGVAAAPLRRARDGWRAARRRRLAGRELRRLPDHVLRDLGLRRDGIDESVAALDRAGERTAPGDGCPGSGPCDRQGGL